MKFSRLNLLVIVAIACLATNEEAAPQGGGGFTITWSTIDAGGGVSTAGGFELFGTVGQPDVGFSTADGYKLSGGFLIGSYCMGDISGPGSSPDRIVGDLDIVAMIVSWGECDAPCPADINCDGEVDVDDLVQIILLWGACPED